VGTDDGVFAVVSLTLYGGVNEIGGNKVVLEDSAMLEFSLISRTLAQNDL